MPLAFALVAYALSMTVANLLIARFGPGISPFLAFVLIGMDLALRDWLHVRLRFWQMGALIAFTGALTYALNPAAGQIAVASTLAFTGAAVADWLVFTVLRGRWLLRANASNVAGAAVDSVLFPTLAFGSFMPGIVLLQFAAKVAGGALWSWALSRGMRAGSTRLGAQG